MSVGKESYVPAFVIGQPITGSTAQKVIESQNDSYKVGDIIVSFGNWEKYTMLSEGTVLNKVENIVLPLSYYLGTLGPVGVTAYHGLLDLAEPKEGETVYVSGAAGAVGLLVGQIAKIKGCRVIGSAGTDEKVAALVNDFGFDYAFNYKTVVNQRAKLQEFCPSGIDVYFDNVGGETLDIVLTLMNVHGRITCCGMISQYNATTPYKLKNLINVVGKQLKLQGFIVGVQFADPAYMKKFGNDMATWMKGGRLKYSENAVEGLENAPKAFIGMLNGQNTGKAIVKLA